MSFFANVCAVVGILVGVFGILCFEGFCVAGMPNASPELMATIKRVMLIGGVVGVLFIAGAIWLMASGRPWWAAGVGAAPTVIAIGWLSVTAMSE